MKSNVQQKKFIEVVSTVLAMVSVEAAALSIDLVMGWWPLLTIAGLAGIVNYLLGSFGVHVFRRFRKIKLAHQQRLEQERRDQELEAALRELVRTDRKFRKVGILLKERGLNEAHAEYVRVRERQSKAVGSRKAADESRRSDICARARRHLPEGWARLVVNAAEQRRYDRAEFLLRRLCQMLELYVQTEELGISREGAALMDECNKQGEDVRASLIELIENRRRQLALEERAVELGYLGQVRVLCDSEKFDDAERLIRIVEERKSLMRQVEVLERSVAALPANAPTTAKSVLESHSSDMSNRDLRRLIHRVEQLLNGSGRVKK